MNPAKYALLFLIIAIPLALFATISASEAVSVNEDVSIMDMAFDAAADAAAEALTIVNDGKIVLTRENAVDAFFMSLYASLGVTDDPVARRNVELYIPAICVSTGDGLYIYYFTDETDEFTEEQISHRRWSERIPYCMEEQGYVVQFLSDDEILLTDTYGLLPDPYTHATVRCSISKLTSQPWYHAFAVSCPDLRIADPVTLRQLRYNVMYETIEEQIGYQITRHNSVASDYGIGYYFSIPLLTDEDFSDIDNPVFWAFFQGYPLEGASAYYQRYSASSARITKAALMYYSESGGIAYYHHEGCPVLDTVSRVYAGTSALECEKHGAYPCPVCCPDIGRGR